MFNLAGDRSEITHIAHRREAAGAGFVSEHCRRTNGYAPLQKSRRSPASRWPIKRLVIQTSPHILVVDDDQEIRRLLGRYLDSQGFRVTLAADRREFEKTFPDSQIDLVVLDVMLPDGSGLIQTVILAPMPSATQASLLQAEEG